MAHKFAIENGHIIADVVEAVEFPDMSQKYRVMSVPKTVINETTEFIGSQPEDQFLDQVLKAVEAQ